MLGKFKEIVLVLNLGTTLRRKEPQKNLAKCKCMICEILD